MNLKNCLQVISTPLNSQEFRTFSRTVKPAVTITGAALFFYTYSNCNENKLFCLDKKLLFRFVKTTLTTNPFLAHTIARLTYTAIGALIFRKTFPSILYFPYKLAQKIYAFTLTLPHHLYELLITTITLLTLPFVLLKQLITYLISQEPSTSQ